MAQLGIWPATLKVNYCKPRMDTSQIVTGGESEQVIDRMRERWLMTVGLPPRKYIAAGELEGFIARFRGQVNWIKLWHFARPKPTGTMAGAPTLNTQALQFADELRIATTAFATLKRGDMLGTGTLLHMAAEDCEATAGGLLVVPLVNRVRITQPAGTVVVWNKPTTSFRLVSADGVGYVPGNAEPVTLEFREKLE